MRPYLLIADVFAFAVAGALAGTLHPVQGASLIALVIVFAHTGLYRSRLTLSLLDDLPFVLAGAGASLALGLGLVGTVPASGTRGHQVQHALTLLAVVCVVRWLAYTVVRRARAHGLVRHRTAILGAGDLGLHLAELLREHRSLGLDPVGFIDDQPPRAPENLLPAPLLGGYDDMATIIELHDVRDVIVAFGEKRESELVDVLRACDRLDVEVFTVPRLFELHNSNRDTDEVRGIPLVRNRRAAFRSLGWPVKRAFDVVVSAALLLLLFPLLAACALAVRLEGGPGVIFRQERVGLDGNAFQLLKFRSLKPQDDAESQVHWNIAHDHRLGAVGRFLRRSSLDELPQLWNILRGDMSLVGPRPERPYFVNQFARNIPRYTARHRVPAGLTGWAQAHGLRGDTSIEERARFDNFYIENWSLWLDLKIMVRTIGQVLRRSGG